MCLLHDCRLESELRSLQEQLSSAPKQHQLESLQSAMTVVQSSLQQSRDQLHEREETNSHLQEQLSLVKLICTHCVQNTCACMDIHNILQHSLSTIKIKHSIIDP